jgi:uncharacterized protein with FMN-binding domain
MKPSSSKRIAASAVLIVASLAYVIYLNVGGSEEFSATNQVPKATNTATSPVRSAPAPVTAAATPAPVPKTSGQYADGTYTGSAANAYYGTVEVQASVSGGALTGVTFLQYPSDRSTSREINAQAMPILKSEAIQAQSANVDIVSGATDTSLAFRQSLGSALAQAKN